MGRGDAREAGMSQGRTIDSTRASLAGHTFHHAWAARSCLELLPADTDLQRIALEGFAKDNTEVDVSQVADEVADLVRYRGGPDALTAHRIEVVQFKYSIARAEVAVRAADLAKTAGKFAQALRDHRADLGRDRADAVLRFEYLTNRPVDPDLEASLKGLAGGEPMTPRAADQAEALRRATGLDGDDLALFARNLSVVGRGGSVRQVQGALARLIANWNGGADFLAIARLRALCDFVDEIAGMGGQSRNTIGRVDVLGALQIADEDELFPAKAAFPEVEKVIPRDSLGEVLDRIAAVDRPLLLHATGGMGKTVLMQSLAEALSGQAEVLLFDGFGGGRWRDPKDGRHLPEKGLLQIANQLAARGLCDLILPGQSSVTDLVRAFRKRLAQAIALLEEQTGAGEIVLLLDAIDHSALQAQALQGASFAALLLETFSIDPMTGVKLIASCRTERLDLTRGAVRCETFELPGFSEAESRALILARHPEASETDIAAATGRSLGCPRILNLILRNDPPFEAALGGDQLSASDTLDALIAKQVDEARENARAFGATDTELDRLMTGLALLPPPVPLEELALAQALAPAAIQGFVADLFPLIEQTPHGLIFRDEPTETYLRNQAETAEAPRQAVLDRLRERQPLSNYAARALPLVLRALGLKAELYALACDDGPLGAASDVADRAIRRARLDAALQVAAADRDTDRLLGFTLELARTVGGHGRSDRYLRDNPDLVAISEDPEAFRRLFEDTGSWPGARHASLAVAALMSGDETEARRNMRRAFEWHDWRIGRPADRNLPRRRPMDAYGPVWAAAALGDARRVSEWILQHSPGEALALAGEVVRLLDQHADLSEVAADRRDRLMVGLSGMARPPSVLLHAVLMRSSALPAGLRARLHERLAKAEDLSLDQIESDSRAAFNQVIAQAAIAELDADRKAVAKALLDKLRIERPSIHEFDRYSARLADTPLWLAAGLARALAEGRPLTLFDIAPVEIDQLVRRKTDRRTPARYLAAVTEALTAKPPPQRRKTSSGRDNPERLKRFVDSRSKPIIAALAAAQAAFTTDGAEGLALDLFARCAGELQALSTYPERDSRSFSSLVVAQIALRVLRGAPGLKPETAAAVQSFYRTSPHHVRADRIEVAGVLARRPGGEAAALELTQAIGKELSGEASTNLRIRDWAVLARAIWPLSRAEARQCFLNGLNVADSFSADDIEETYGLIALAEHYRGPPLAPEIVHEFQRLCEMQAPEDDDRYDWRAHAVALARMGRLDGLAISARLADRERGGLRHNHEMIAAALVDAGRLPADLGAVLIGLEGHRDWLAFRMTDYLERILPGLERVQAEQLFQYAATELDRRLGLGLPRDLLKGLNGLAGLYLPPDHDLRLRFAALLAWKQVRDQPEDAQEGEGVLDAGGDDSTATLEAMIASADLSMSEGLDQVLAGLPRKKGEGPSLQDVLCRLREGARLPDQQIKLLDVLLGVQAARVQDVIQALQGALETWRENSPAVESRMETWTLALAGRHAAALSQGGWDGSYWQRQLADITGVDGALIAAEILKNLGGEAAQIDQKGWLMFARRLGSAASDAAIGQGLTRYVRAAGKAILDDFGDGPWSARSVVSDDPVEAVAGLLWARLGAADARTRWRAAHAVRRAVDLGRPEVFDSLMARIEAADAGPFHDARTPFHFLNAKLWLLLAAARIGLDRPERLRPHQTALEAIALSAALPHALIREVAASALKALATVLPKDEADALQDRIRSVNRSPFKAKHRKNFFHADVYSKTPEDYVRQGADFHFDYDFSKYQIMDVANLFGTHQYEVADRIAAWVRRWAPEATDMWSPRGGDGDSWSGGRPPATEGWHGHLAWHGLFLTAGDLLAQAPLVTTEWERKPWAYWLSQEMLSRDDGRWRADDTALTPLDSGLDPTDGAPSMPARAVDLLPLAHLAEKDAEEVVVSGYWKTWDGLDVNVFSAMVPNAQVREAAWALTLLNGHDVWLPHTEHEDRYHRNMKPVKAWLTSVQYARESGIDETDPYAVSTTRAGDQPSDEVCKALGLKAIDPFERLWANKDGIGFRSEAWGYVSGSGRHERSWEGRRSLATPALIRNLCKASDSSLLIIVFVRRFLEEARGDRALPSRWVVAILDETGRIKPVVRVPASVRAAAKTARNHPRPELEDLLRAIRVGILSSPRPAGSSTEP
jgi:hypothetical protein